MGNLVPVSLWGDVPHFEADAVLTGGADCPDNIPIQALLNRTEWLNANKQAAHALLTALAGLAAGANKLPYFTGASSMGVATISAFILTLLDDANATAALATLGAAPLASPGLTGTPTAPTAATGTNTTQIATTAFVQAAVAALIASSPAALDTLNELAAALGNDANFATTMTNALAGKAPLASPALTGTPTAPTAAVGTSTTQVATTAFVNNELADAGIGNGSPSKGLFDLNTAALGTFIGVNGTEADAATYNWPTTGVTGTNPVWWNVATYGSASRLFQMATQAFGGANFQNRTFIRAKHDTVWSAWKELGFLDSPIFTGTPTAPTAATATNNTQLATTAYVVARIVQDIAGKANLASPALTGTPTAPTAADGTNTTQIATTAFVQAAVAALIASSPAALDTLNELAAALGNDANFATTMTNALAGKASTTTPTITGKARFQKNRVDATWGQSQIEAYAEAGSTEDFASVAFHCQDQSVAMQFGYHGGAARLGWFDGSGTEVWGMKRTGEGIQLKSPIFFVSNAAGSVNSIAASFSPAITELVDGMLLTVDALGANNSGNVTFTPNSGTIAASPVKRFDGQELVVGDMVAGYRMLFSWDATNSRWIYLNPKSGGGGYLGTRVFTAGGTYTPSAGTRYVVVEAVGGGGAGGGTPITGAGSFSIAGGGGAGAWGRALFDANFSGVTVTIGAAGVGAAGGAGGNGGTTSFGALLSCPGGNGAPVGSVIPSTTNVMSSMGLRSAAPTGATLGAKSGSCGGRGINLTGGTQSGKGADSEYGVGGDYVGIGTTASGQGYGSGGSGYCAGANTATAQAGGNGAPGLVLVWEFA